MSFRRLTRSLTCLGQGALAWVFVGLVVTLNFLAVSPEAHAYFHQETGDSCKHHDAAKSDEGCAVTLFQNGVTPPLALPQIEAPRFTWIVTRPAVLVTFCYSRASQALPPARGPPSSV